MPRSVYFSQGSDQEADLYENLIVESLQIYGQEVYYLPRTIVNRDEVLNHATGSTFDDAYMIEAYIDDAEGFGGAGDLYQKFGVEIRDEVTFTLSRRRWNRFIGIHNNDVTNDQPVEGDIIYLPLSNSFFEIMFVEHEQPFYQLANLPVFKLKCSLWEYNDEELDTGIDAIDSQQQHFGYKLGMQVNITNEEYFAAGEKITQIISPEISVFGTIQTTKHLSSTSNEITVSNIGVIGTEIATNFSVGEEIIGDETGYVGVINNIYDITSDEFLSTDGGAQNAALEKAAEEFIDFSEENPFGSF